MAKPARGVAQFEDAENKVLHLCWSRSGRHLIVTAASSGWEGPRQVELSGDQVSDLIEFLTETAALPPQDR
jgi:hypothetical protein